MFFCRNLKDFKSLILRTGECVGWWGGGGVKNGAKGDRGHCV